MRTESALGLDGLTTNTALAYVDRKAKQSRSISTFSIPQLVAQGEVLERDMIASVEYAFHWLFGVDAMRYAGGALGLALGYLVKFRLDRRFVFVRDDA